MAKFWMSEAADYLSGPGGLHEMRFLDLQKSAYVLTTMIRKAREIESSDHVVKALQKSRDMIKNEMSDIRDSHPEPSIPRYYFHLLVYGCPYRKSQRPPVRYVPTVWAYM